MTILALARSDYKTARGEPEFMERQEPRVANPLIATMFTSLLLCTPPVLAVDAWEPNDGIFQAYSATALLSGHTPQFHDLEAVGGFADVDYYVFLVFPGRSYEVVADSLANTLLFKFQRVSLSGVLQTSAAAAVRDGPSNFKTLEAQIMRWQETIAPTEPQQFIKVVGDAQMTSSSKYSIRFRETTLFCPRFNNSGTQVSVLLIQSALTDAGHCEYTTHAFDESGTPLGGIPGSFFTNNAVTPMSTVSLANVFPGQKGSMQISHTCGYGNLKAKVVALEPATGFSFDTPCTVREQ